MPQISKIGFNNFRVFDQVTEFDLSRINILTGTNGSGKSSIFKGLMLLFESLKRSKSFQNLNFNLGENKLGSFKNSINSEEKYDKIIFEFELDYTTKFKSYVAGLEDRNTIFDDIITLSFHYGSDNQNGDLKIFAVSHSNKNNTNSKTTEKKEILAYVKFQENEGDNTYMRINFQNFIERITQLGIDPKNPEKKGFLKSPDRNLRQNWMYNTKDVNYYNLFNLQNGLFKEENIIKILNNSNNTEYDVNAPKFQDFFANFSHLTIDEESLDEENYMRNIFPNRKFEDAFLRYFSYQTNFDTEVYLGDQHWMHESINEYIPELEGKLLDYLNPELISIFEIIKGSLDTIFSDFKSFEFYYIAAFRGIPQRIYLFQENDTIIHRFINEIWIKKLPKHKSEYLDLWVKNFGIADKVDFELVENVGVVISFIKNNNKTNIADMGYGVTQIFPLIIGVLMNSKTTQNFETNPPLNFLLIEEPESNLHPALQSKLGDFFIDAIKKFDVKLIIETHSEYLIRKLQYGVAEKKINPQDVNLYYFNNPKTKSENVDKEIVRKINIQDNGFLDGEFGPGFFDVSDELYLDLFSLNNKAEAE